MSKKRVFYLVLVGLLILTSVTLTGAQEQTKYKQGDKVPVHVWNWRPAPGTPLQDTTQFAKPGPWKIGFSNASLSNSWRYFFLNEIKWAASWYPEIAELYVTDANDKPEKQISDVEDLLSKGIDLLILSPATTEALGPAVDKAVEKGVPVVLADRTAASPNYTCFVTADMETEGALGAQFIADTIGGKGKIVLESGVAGAGPAELRLKGAKSVFEKYPDIEIAGHCYTDWSRSKAKVCTEDFMQSHPDLDAIWSDSGQQAAAVIDAYTEAGLPVPPVTGEDYNGFLKLWKSTGANSFAFSHPQWMGATAVDMAVRILNGYPVPKDVWVNNDLITNENLDQYVKPGLSDDYWAGNDLPEDWIPKL